MLTTVMMALMASSLGADDPVSFDREIRPLLATRCILCHGNAEESRRANLRLDTMGGLLGEMRDGGRVVVPGDPAASGLYQRISTDNPDVRMPPADEGHDALSPQERLLIHRWIKQGAKWEQHWAWVAPIQPVVPDMMSHPVDAFINRRVERAGLKSSPRADRATLLRRASLDLIGLPPTPEEVDLFLQDDQPGAWDRQVQRLLDSPHFGERWARVWLDHARYADSRGYEKDADRTIWPWRDWVINAFNQDVPFDQFTVEQLAGDMLDDPTPEQVLATAFHRNTMTNDEGGTDDEEFRIAAIVDRTNTTMQAWMGLTIGCAQCHDHPSDPFSHREYYGLFAMLNQTQDADRTDEHPVLPVLSLADQSLLEITKSERMQAEEDLNNRLAVLATEHIFSEISTTERGDRYWIDDDLPVGANANEVNGEVWPWQKGHEKISAFSGSRMHVGSASGPTTVRQQYFESAYLPLVLQEGDQLVAHVWLDPEDPPAQIMLQFHMPGDWEHRAFWGGDHNPWGQLGTTSRIRIGDLPQTGQWVRLELDPAVVGLKPGDAIDGWAFTQAGGTVAWDAAGVVRDEHIEQASLHSLQAFEARQRSLLNPVIPEDVLAVIRTPMDQRDPAGQTRLEHWYLRNVQIESRQELAALLKKRELIDQRIAAIEASAALVPVMRSVSPEMARTTHVLERGSFLSPGDEIDPHVPELLHPLKPDRLPDRMALAKWIASRENPLTARVHVNRTWERLFGRGLVVTLEDFGTQGDRPTHPDLLDWLAVDFMDQGWSHKELCRLIVTSETYQRSPAPQQGVRELDPENRWLSHAPRVRLEAEAVRDQALAASGLLDAQLHGPPVFPDQPAGLWQVTYDNRDWPQGEDRQRHRRGIYTFWRRSSPYPSMTTFDAPSREICSVRRIQTNTPLQALVTLNDPVYVEAAKALASRMVEEGGEDDSARLQRGFRLVLGRMPTSEELSLLMELAQSARRQYLNTPGEMEAILLQWPGTPPSSAGSCRSCRPGGGCQRTLESGWRYSREADDESDSRDSSNI